MYRKKIILNGLLLIILISFLLLVSGCGRKLTGNPQNFEIEGQDKLVFGKVSVFVKRYNEEEKELSGRDIHMCINIYDSVTGQREDKKCGYVSFGSTTSVRSDEKPYYGYVMQSMPDGLGSIASIRVDNYLGNGSLSFAFQGNLQFIVDPTSNATYFGNIAFHIYEQAPFEPEQGRKGVRFPRVKVAVEDSGHEVVEKLEGLPEALTDKFTSNLVEVVNGPYSATYSKK